jgi:hypothetical protein
MSKPEASQEEIDALFLEFDAEFGKKKKAPAAPKPVRVPQISEGQEANRLAELMSENSMWKAVAVVSYIVRQRCDCCRGETEHVGNTVIRHVHKRMGVHWDHVLPYQGNHTTLPHEIYYFPQTIKECPLCLRFNLHINDIKTEYPLQYDFFAQH